MMPTKEQIMLLAKDRKYALALDSRVARIHLPIPRCPVMNVFGLESSGAVMLTINGESRELCNMLPYTAIVPLYSGPDNSAPNGRLSNMFGLKTLIDADRPEPLPIYEAPEESEHHYSETKWGNLRVEFGATVKAQARDAVNFMLKDGKSPIVPSSFKLAFYMEDDRVLCCPEDQMILVNDTQTNPVSMRILCSLISRIKHV
jgi:hypothetical protein